MNGYCLFLEISSKETKNLHIVQLRFKKKKQLHRKILPFNQSPSCPLRFKPFAFLKNLNRKKKVTACTLVQHDKDNT